MEVTEEEVSSLSEMKLDFELSDRVPFLIQGGFSARGGIGGRGRGAPRGGRGDFRGSSRGRGAPRGGARGGRGGARGGGGPKGKFFS